MADRGVGSRVAGSPMRACGTAAGRSSKGLGTQSPAERVSSYGLVRHRAGPWMNRCGLTSGKKKPGYCSKSNNEISKIKKSSREASWTQELSLRCFQDKPSKKKIPLQEDWRCLSQTGRAVHLSLTVFLASFLLRVLWGSRNSPLPPEAGLRLLGRPFLPPLAYTAS